jgi:multidrug resistance efflux pump
VFTKIITKYVMPLVAIGLLGFAVYFVRGQNPKTEPTPPVAPPPQSPFDYTVAGAGIVEAQTENIAIGSSTPGVVVEVFVKVGQKVAVGDKLFRLDDRMLQAELRSRQAAVGSAKAELQRLENQPRPEQLRMSSAQLSESKANLATQQDQLNRAKELFNRKVDTAENLVARQQAVRVAEAQVARAQAEYDMQENGAWEQDINVARVAVARAEAQVEHALTELDRLIVRALVAGEVLQVNVRPGEFVGAPPDQALIILGNIQLLHVRVDIDENDIPRFVPGSPGVAMLRGQSDVEFPLTFVRVEPYVVPKRSLTGDNTERVDTRVLQVIYSIDAGGRPLYVGQQLDVYVKAPEAGKTRPTARREIADAADEARQQSSSKP